MCENARIEDSGWSILRMIPQVLITEDYSESLKHIKV